MSEKKSSSVHILVLILAVLAGVVAYFAYSKTQMPQQIIPDEMPVEDAMPESPEVSLDIMDELPMPEPVAPDGTHAEETAKESLTPALETTEEPVKDPMATEEPTAEEPAPAEDTPPETELPIEEMPAETPAQEELQEAAAAPSINIKAALKDRILGNQDAPIKISEHASLTCSHCAKFHRETFKALKEAYIDTGKAYLVFSDFPLNGPALHASMTARCLPKKEYFEFIGMLFEKQEEWAYDPSYMTFLKAQAAAFGMDGETFEACIKNEELQQGIAQRMQAAQEQWSINATPTFVINNKTTINGALPFDMFSQKIEEATAQETPATATP